MRHGVRARKKDGEGTEGEEIVDGDESSSSKIRKDMFHSLGIVGELVAGRNDRNSPTMHMYEGRD